MLGASAGRPFVSEMRRDWRDRLLPSFRVPSVVEGSCGPAMALRPLSYPLRNRIMDVGVLSECVASVVVGGVVNGVNQHCDGRELLERADVPVAQQERMKIGVRGMPKMQPSFQCMLRHRASAIVFSGILGNPSASQYATDVR